MRARWIWFALAGAVSVTLTLKAIELGWLTAHPPLDLAGRPAILFFFSQRGCDCMLVVFRSAEAQLAAWPETAHAGVPLHPISLDQRPDLAERYEVVRAPTLVLLDAAGAIVWRQDESLSDTAPLDLDTLEAQIDALTTINAN